MSDEVVLVDLSDRIATITLHRPAQRNALSRELQRQLRRALTAANDSDEVDVVILTGSDPAFSAGVDLKEIGSGASNLGQDPKELLAPTSRGPFPPMDKPVIGAINGVAVTGGFELALNCDFLIASEQAKFGDTHARVGVMPGWGLTVLLSEAVGVRRARELSFTGNFLSAEQAFAWGLVNHVVAHEELIPTARRLAADIISNDQPGVRQIRRTYAAVTANEDGWAIEVADSRRWLAERFTPEAVAERRAAIQARGRTQ